MTFGGGATLLSVGLHPDEWNGRSTVDIAARVDELAPDLVPTLWTYAPYARSGDVLFSPRRPRPVPGLDRFEHSADRLWIRGAFFASPDSSRGRGLGVVPEGGISRVVFGHTPVDRPTFSHDGRALNLDTWRGQEVTLARLEPGRDLRDATFLAEPVEARLITDAPISADDIRGLDADLPAVVDAWVAAHAPSGFDAGVQEDTHSGPTHAGRRITSR